MPARRERSVTITIFLLKKAVKNYTDALDREVLVNPVPFADNAPIDGALYVKQDQPKPPGWLGLVRPLVGDHLANLRSLSTAAVLFVKAGGRIFAVTFGYGRSLLHPGSYERDFGMRVAVNRVDPASLRSIDVRNYDELVVSTRKQTSRSTNLSTFGLDVYKDLLKAVVGTPTDQSFARRVAGADSVTLVCPLRIEDLPAKCRACLTAYQDNKYKAAFGWIDHLEQMRDPAVIDKLEVALLQELKAHADGGSVYLAPAEIEDWDDIDAFDFSGRRNRAGEGFDDLDIADYLSALGEDRADLTIEKLKSHVVRVKRNGSPDFENRWSVFHCLVWEGMVGRHRYALYDQKWFKIDDDFNREIEAAMAAIPAPAFAVLPSKKDEPEEDYNARVARGRDYALLDQKCVTLPGTGSPIEVCDVLSAQGHFIHVKRKTRSATLSHLFAQGTVSGDLFLGSLEFRRQLRAKLGRKPRHGALVTDARPAAGRFEVAYLVIAKPGPRRALPFFSRVNLKQAYQRLTTLGFKVSFGFVDEG